MSQVKQHIDQLSQFIQEYTDYYFKPKVKNILLNEGTVYSSCYYTVEPEWIPNSDGFYSQDWNDMMAWCIDTFGPSTGSIWRETKNLTPEPLQRWYANNRKFWFKDSKDRDWFILRWST